MWQSKHFLEFFFTESILDIINNNYGALLVVAALLSGLYVIRAYEKSNAPLVVFNSFDFENQKILITNDGKGDAVNISVCAYSIMLDTKEKKPEELKIESKTLGFLGSGKQGEIQMVGDEIVFLNKFAHSQSDESFFNKNSTPLYIEYKNPGNKRFLTKVIIKQGEFISKHLGNEWLIRKICRDLICFFNRDRILFIHRIKYFFLK